MQMHWVDVFATGPMAGNPLAVITGARWPSAAAMQRMATELGLSETVFACPGTPPRLRIFTPEAEIPKAGHPLVGAADPTALAGCMGARACGDAPIWDAGLPQALLEVDDIEVLQPDHDAIRARGAREGWAGASAYVMQARGAGAAVARVRHFAAPIGIPEDPVTGSAAGALGARLAASGMAGDDGVLQLTVLQGHALGRPGEVRVRVTMDRGVPGAVEVGGAVVPIMAGDVEPGALQG